MVEAVKHLCYFVIVFVFTEKALSTRCYSTQCR